MSPEALVLGVFSGLRPGTSLAAVLALLKAPAPGRRLVVFSAAGLASTWAVGMLVVLAFHGASTDFGGSTFTAVLDVALGAAALGFAAGIQRGWVQPTRRRDSTRAPSEMGGRIVRSVRDPSARVAAVAGVATHIPGLIYLVALNAIASRDPGVVGAAIQVAVYDVLWFLVPIAAIVLTIVRPGAALAYLEAATAWVRAHEHGVVMGSLVVVGSYLLVNGALKLLT